MSNGARKSLKAARPVGHLGVPDRSAMSQGELEERRATVTKLRDLSEKAQNGDEEAALDIREILDGSPDLAWRFIKGPGKMAEAALIDEMTRDEDLASKELLKHQLESMRIEVSGENPSPLERLLAERVVATWLQVQLFDAFYAFGMKSGTIIQDEHRQRPLPITYPTHSKRRHLHSISIQSVAEVEVLYLDLMLTGCHAINDVLVLTDGAKE